MHYKYRFAISCGHSKALSVGSRFAASLLPTTSRDRSSTMRLIELSITLLVGALIGAGLAAAISSKPAADPGDWLAFTGALVGVVATIIGTLWLEHRRASTQERKQRRMILSVLNEIAAGLEAVSEPRGEADIKVARPARIEAEETLLRAFEKFDYARYQVPEDDVDSWQSIDALNEAILRHKSVLEREIDHLHAAGDNENVFGVNVNIMAEMEAGLRPVLETAKRKIGR